MHRTHNAGQSFCSRRKRTRWSKRHLHASTCIYIHNKSTQIWSCWLTLGMKIVWMGAFSITSWEIRSNCTQRWIEVCFHVCVCVLTSTLSECILALCFVSLCVCITFSCVCIYIYIVACLSSCGYICIASRDTHIRMMRVDDYVFTLTSTYPIYTPYCSCVSFSLILVKWDVHGIVTVVP